VDGGEALQDCERGAEPKGTDGTDRQTASSYRGVDLSVAGKFYEGDKAALAFDDRSGSGGEKAVLERQVEELQKPIGEQAVEIRFLKRLSKS
jgi:hypothetical protein